MEKKPGENFDTLILIKIIDAKGKNMIKVDKEEYKNLKIDNEVKVDKNQEFEIIYFSNNYLVINFVLVNLYI